MLEIIKSNNKYTIFIDYKSLCISYDCLLFYVFIHLVIFYSP